MALFWHTHLHPEGEVGIWDIREEENFFFEKLDLTSKEKTYLNQIMGKGRRLQWLATRHLLHVLSGREMRGTLWKDEFGKPHLEGSLYQISISHSHEMAAIMAAPVPVGIDIQHFVPKIGRLAYKYMRDVEMDSLEESTRLEHLHVYWCAKEAIYKAYSRRQLDFRAHILVEPFAYKEPHLYFKGKLVKEDLVINYDLWFERLGDYFLVYGQEVKKKS